jgi:hypothetical protein
MDGLQINQKIRYGYAKAAKKLGKPFNLYRSPNAIDPLNPSNLIGSIKMAPSQDWTWMKANRPGNAIWYVCVDGQERTEPLSAREMDYLVDAESTFFILSKQYQMPMQAVECNDVIRVIRPSQSLQPGKQGYASFTPESSEVLMDLVPCSILMNRQGQKPKTNLPTDTYQPSWLVMFPYLDSVNVRTGDVIIDSTNQQYVMGVTERTDFGWRVIASQTVN